MARFIVPFACFAAFISLGSCAIPSSWDELLGSDSPLFPQTLSTKVLSATNTPVLHSRVIRELSDMLDNSEISSTIYSKYLVEYEKPERRNNLNVFKKNLMLIAKRNLLFHTGKSSWEEGINKFTDMPHDELRQYYGGMPANPEPPTGLFTVSNLTLKQVPDSLDWRKWGAVGPVKDQGGCGSCWAFASNVAVEGNQAIVNGGPVIPLSEQDLVSCYKKSCNGEFQWNALDYISSNGVATALEYPYTSGNGRAGSCKKTKKKVANGLTYTKVSQESDYKANCAQYGPFTVSFYFHDDMMRARRGVYDGACGQDANGNPDGFHAVGIVGYGRENGLDYWIIKNSYGIGFADRGYMKIRAGVDKCGVQSYIGGIFVTTGQ